MKKDRQQVLLSHLAMTQGVSLAEAMEILGVSESTARRLFARLEQEGYAIRTHGGIRSVETALTRYSFESTARQHMGQKEAIGRAASAYLSDGDVIFCDSGTTIQCFCAHVARRLSKEHLDLKVYTNSLANLEILSPHLEVSLIGGTYRANRKDFCGFLSEQALQGIYFTKCFIGADGCAGCREFTTTDFETARMNQIAIANSEQTYMLMDASKFSVSSHVAYAPLRVIHTIITDDAISQEHRTALGREGARLVTAPVFQPEE